MGRASQNPLFLYVFECFFYLLISQPLNDFLECDWHNSGPHIDKHNNRFKRQSIAWNEGKILYLYTCTKEAIKNI